MSIKDKLKGIGKNAKEQAVFSAISPAMQLIESWTKDIKPENDISMFIEDKYGILFESQSSKESESEGIMRLLTKLAIAEANASPEFVENKLLRFYNEFRVWYKEYLASASAKGADKKET